ncbi:calcium-binding protein [Rhizobium sp. ARZ01]|uniref:calcium-binding protein n=1 Tax=Rhizobium sp. ARZ01 TaxID=2769313 RepID=UPI001784632F|nr:calcium-binding protein [Rhizobium sp. ARZ01]
MSGVWVITITNGIDLAGGDDTYYGAIGQDVVYGGAGNDRLEGRAGNDFLYGGAGIDTLVGGTGDDEYEVDSTDGVVDTVIEDPNAGTDTIRYRPTAGVTFVLAANVEIGRLYDGANANLSGNSLNNTLDGNNQDNILRGGDGHDRFNPYGGNDSIYGGKGNDYYYLASPGIKKLFENANEGTDTVKLVGDSFAAAYTLVANIENLILTGKVGSGTGNSANNVIYASSRHDANQSLYGLDGNDKLVSGVSDHPWGDDYRNINLYGGKGDDVYVITFWRQKVVELAGEGIDTVQYDGAAGNTYTLTADVEKLVLIGSNATHAFGNGLANTMTGNSGANVLDGLLGDDSLSGGAGNDTLKGGAGNDRLNGGTGVDTMTGGTGNDIYYADHASDRAIEASNGGTDVVVFAGPAGQTYTLSGNIERLTLSGTTSNNGTGNTLNNVIVGNGGANKIGGGWGNDTLTGGAGRDAFVFNTFPDASLNCDRITDFSVKDDVIYLENMLFTKIKGTGTLSSAQFKVNKTGAAEDSSDRIIYESDTGKLFYDMDGKGGGGGEHFATLSAGLKLTNADFFII